MGNWSSVIITFSGLDRLACDDDNDDYGQKRCREIHNWLSTRERVSKKIIVSPSCGPDSLGMAAEVVMLFHADHFQISDEFHKFLKFLPWQKPNEVEVFFKDEENDNYKRFCLDEREIDD